MVGVYGRVFAALRMLLVAVSVCLMGAAPFAERAVSVAGRTHAEDVGLPDPGPAVAEERDEDPRGEDDDLAHGPRPGLTVLSAHALRVRSVRGPAAPPPALDWRPRSSRGPPAQVAAPVGPV